jgi:hypothetical protein
MAFSIVSVNLASGETALCGVTLEPYVVLKKNDGTQITADEAYEEGTSDGNYQLRSRWYRSTINRGANYCSVHHDAEATVQCMICLRGKCPVHLSYHCSTECLKSSWHLHKDYHRQSHANGMRACQRQASQPAAAVRKHAPVSFQGRRTGMTCTAGPTACTATERGGWRCSSQISTSGAQKQDVIILSCRSASHACTRP